MRRRSKLRGMNPPSDSREVPNHEDSTEKHVVSPGSIIPARELLGDMLMELGSKRRCPQRIRDVDRQGTESLSWSLQRSARCGGIGEHGKGPRVVPKVRPGRGAGRPQRRPGGTREDVSRAALKRPCSPWCLFLRCLHIRAKLQ
jgi:hypothetical protein